VLPADSGSILEDLMDREATRSGRGLRALGLCVAAAIAPGCGGDKSPVGPHIENVVVFRHESSFGGLARFAVFVTDFAVPEEGTLRITVDWTLSTNDIDVVLSNPACDTVALAAGSCKVLGTDQGNAKPAGVTLSTSATAYRLFVVNRGPESESGTVLATVTQSRLVQ
jgi:hypothetical protein